MLEGDGKPKSINLNRILSLPFFFLCFAFPLKFKLFMDFPWHVPGSAVAPSASRESLPLLSSEVYVKFLSSVFFSFFFSSILSEQSSALSLLQ